MCKRVLKLLLICNLLMLIFFLGDWLYIEWIASLGGPGRITDLDRAGVIDEAKLRETYPKLASNMRRDLGMWVAQKERSSANHSAMFGSIFAAFNFALLLVLHKKNDRATCPTAG